MLKKSGLIGDVDSLEILPKTSNQLIIVTRFGWTGGVDSLDIFPQTSIKFINRLKSIIITRFGWTGLIGDVDSLDILPQISNQLVIIDIFGWT